MTSARVLGILFALLVVPCPLPGFLGLDLLYSSPFVAGQEFSYFWFFVLAVGLWEKICCTFSPSSWAYVLGHRFAVPLSLCPGPGF